MIPFFRKIRKKMADDNKPLKYMRYAIGEIVLVVIGILIALQINNWNEDRKDNIKKMVLKKSLIEDLKKDTTQLWNEIRYTTKAIQFHQKFINMMEKNDATLDTILGLFTFHDHGRMGLKEPNKTTYESLLSTGDIKIFSDQEIEAIMLFYDKIEVDYYVILDRYRYTYEKLFELAEKYGFLTKENKDNLIYETLRENMDKREFIRLFDVAEYSFLGTLSLSKNRSERLLKDTNNLLKVLSDEIN
jgi:hypothetical protein